MTCGKDFMNSKIYSFKDLEVWKKSCDLSVEVYSITNNFPKEEIYGITSQIRRSAVSIPSNIAEGCARDSTKEYIRFISIALGSVAELRTQIEISLKVGFLNEKTFLNLEDKIVTIYKMLLGLKAKLKKI